MSADIGNIMERARNLVGDGQIVKAFTILVSNLELSKVHRAELLVLKNKHTAINSNFTLGLIDANLFLQEKGKTCYAFLFLLDKIEGNDESIKKQLISKPLTYLITLIIILVSTGGFTYQLKKMEADETIRKFNSHYEQYNFIGASKIYNEISMFWLNEKLKRRQKNCFAIKHHDSLCSFGEYGLALGVLYGIQDETIDTFLIKRRNSAKKNKELKESNHGNPDLSKITPDVESSITNVKSIADGI